MKHLIILSIILIFSSCAIQQPTVDEVRFNGEVFVRQFITSTCYIIGDTGTPIEEYKPIRGLREFEFEENGTLVEHINNHKKIYKKKSGMLFPAVTSVDFHTRWEAYDVEMDQYLTIYIYSDKIHMDYHQGIFAEYRRSCN